MNRTYIAIVCDCSGSMQSCRAATIQGINDQLATIRADAAEGGSETFVTLLTFNHEPVLRYRNTAAHLIPDLADEDIVCAGNTAIYDAMGMAITDLMSSTDVEDENTAYAVMLYSDGRENRSRNYTASSLARLIASRQDTKRWTFTYSGANQDLSKVSQDLQIPLSNFALYTGSEIGTANAWGQNTSKLDGYLKARKRGEVKLACFHSDDDSKMADYREVPPPTAKRDG